MYVFNANVRTKHREQASLSLLSVSLSAGFLIVTFKVNYKEMVLGMFLMEVVFAHRCSKRKRLLHRVDGTIGTDKERG